MVADDKINSVEARLLEANLEQIRSELRRQADTLVNISQSLQVLARVEEAQHNIRDRLKDGSQRLTDHERRITQVETLTSRYDGSMRVVELHEKRIAQIEHLVPGLTELRRWVIGGLLAGIGMIGVALMKLVLMP